MYLVQGDVHGPGGCLVQGVSGPGGGVPGPGGGSAWSRVVCSGGSASVPFGIPSPSFPPVNRMTNRCKNITFATTSLRPVIIIFHVLGFG